MFGRDRNKLDLSPHRGYDSDILASPIYYGVGFANEPKHFPGPC